MEASINEADTNVAMINEAKAIKTGINGIKTSGIEITIVDVDGSETNAEDTSEAKSTGSGTNAVSVKGTSANEAALAETQNSLANDKLANDKLEDSISPNTSATPTARPSKVIPETGREKIESLELRYIELLEKKIARLEAQEDPDYTESVAEDSEDEDEGDDEEEPVTVGPSDGSDKVEISEEKQEKGKEASESIENDEKEGEEVKDKKDSVEDKTSTDKERVRYCELYMNSWGQYSDLTVEKPNISKAPEEVKGDEYAISWRLTKKEEDAKPVLLIESHALREALKKVDNDCSSMSFDTEVVAMPWPYELIYHKEQKLRDLAEKAEEATKRDIEILIREVDHRQATERKDATKLAENKQVTYDLLWTLFYPGEPVVQKDIMGKEQVSIIATPHRMPAGETSEKYYLDLWSVDYNGTEFTYLESTISIKSFKGAKAITDLEVFPLKEWEGPNGAKATELKERLIKRGQKFEELCNGQSEGSFRQYKGLMMNQGGDKMLVDPAEASLRTSLHTASTSAGALETKNQDGIGRLESKSLVIIDHDGYFNYANKSLKLGKQTPYIEPCSCSGCVGLRKEIIHDLPRTLDEIKRDKRLTEIQCLLCPPRVFGFGMRGKLWMQLLVDNLELDNKSKDILKTLILQHSRNVDSIDDIIPGKGDGLIVLLHGPPGVGKTLTAESLAKLTGKPLCTVSMTDVGTSPTVVEKNLLRVFSLATHWKALVLFEEADIFLETRSLQDLRRNSLVSVLLRILEYFRGILFLTSNRVKTFDEAFQSRINVAVRYRELSESQRKRIWEMWLDKADDAIEDRTEFDKELSEGGDLTKAELNGRQIRNVFRGAMAMAQARSIGKRKLTLKDVEMVVKRTVEFQTYMLQNKELAEKQGIR
ncbi:MAG: hypothetical protein M1827_003338 [Pycnora praestabilis]|nr:MAG: hypothetical protein M1827_003338 [Pycnora praestabilis]